MLVCGVWLRGSDFVVLVDLVEILGVLEVVFWLHVEWCCCVYGREDLWGGEASVGVWLECGVWCCGGWCWWIGESVHGEGVLCMACA